MPVLILGLLAFTVLWPLWFTVGGALMASDELTAALGPALLDTADGGYAVWTILPSWPTLQPLAELLLDTPQFFSVFWNTCLLAFAQIAGQLVVAAPRIVGVCQAALCGQAFPAARVHCADGAALSGTDGTQLPDRHTPWNLRYAAVRHPARGVFGVPGFYHDPQLSGCSQ